MTLKPLAKSRSMPVLQDIHGRSLTRVADELLLEAAEVLSEGEVEQPDEDDPSYIGSTLVTIPLGEGGLGLELGPDDQTAVELARAAGQSLLFHVRLMRLARAEAESRAAPFLPRGMQVNMEFMIDGDALLIDISVECPLERPLRVGAELGGESL